MWKLIYPDTENSIVPKTEEELRIQVNVPIPEHYIKPLRIVTQKDIDKHSPVKPLEIVTIDTSIPKTVKKKWILSKVKKFIWLK